MKQTFTNSKILVDIIYLQNGKHYLLEDREIKIMHKAALLWLSVVMKCLAISNEFVTSIVKSQN